MEAYILPKYSEDREIEIYFREQALDMELAYNSMCNNDALYMEDGNDSGMMSRLCDKIKSIIEKIREHITNFINIIKSSFGSSTLTPDDFIASDDGKIRLEMDINKATHEIEEEIASEKKSVQIISGLITKIGSKVGIDTSSISNASIGRKVDKVNDFIVNDTGTVVTAAVATIAANKLSDHLKDVFKINKKIEDLNKKIEEQKSLNHSNNMARYEENGNKILSFIEKLSFKVHGTATKTEKTYSSIARHTKTFKKNFKKQKS